MISKIFKLILLLSILIGWYSFADVSDFWWDLKWKLQSKYDKYESEDYLDKIQKWTQLGNIYDQAYEMAQNMQYASDKKSLDYIRSYLTSRWWNCSITENDIYLVFWNSLDGKIISYDTYFSNKWRTQQKPQKTQAESFVDACKKVFQCLWKQTPSEQQQYTIETYNQCMSTITSLHATLTPTIKDANSLKNLNYWDEMFANGSLEDSSYDVLIDIENIGKIFFRDNKQPKKISFYWTNSSRNTPRRLNSNQSLFDQFVSGNRTNLFNSQNNNPSNWYTNYDNISRSIIYNPNNPNYQSTSNQEIWNASIISDWESIINRTCVNWCFPNQRTLNWPNTWDNSASTPDTSDSTTSPRTYDTSSTNIPVYNWNKLGNWAISDIREALFGDNAGENGIDQAAMNSCMNRCEWLSFVDRAVCQSRCSCWAGSSKDDIYKISICLEKSKTRWIAWSKAVMSIEEIVDEIENTFTKMRESGALMPHRKPTEMLETALQMIDLWSIFSFLTVIDKKPIFSADKTEQDKKKEEDEQKEINKSYEEWILWFYEPDTKAWRNRYLVMYNPETSQTLRGPGNSPEVVQTRQNMDNAAAAQKENNPENLAKWKEKQVNNQLFKSVSDFIDYNWEFWNSINEQMNDLNGVARDMKNK